MTSSAPRYSSVRAFLVGAHGQLHGVLADVRRRVDDGELESAVDTLGALRKGLVRCVSFEEAVLFPMVEAGSGMVAPTRVIRDEHRELERIVERMRVALEGGDIAVFYKDFQELNQLLHSHHHNEDQVLYPALELGLSEAQRDELLARLARFS